MANDVQEPDVLVNGCARCGQDHPVSPRQFKMAGVLDFTHWGFCPVTGDPVMVRFEDVPAGDAAAAIAS